MSLRTWPSAQVLSQESYTKNQYYYCRCSVPLREIKERTSPKQEVVKCGR